ncbi:probable nuclear transport factor 2 [Daktulosphaira vitifoliae]|uniref:probable nuclear transport factor 2 n=1 Tax=Daktulosphaira vitifoliae TaxID=58002 RepID=UPI0021AACD97|nr:probable nuclear transport factor 2 [Daktulosphaira vitifoliae]
MALNPQYEAIGKGFVGQYYQMFDDASQRASLVTMYNPETSFMSFEGVPLQGANKIMEKFNSLTFQKITRDITSVDSQPMFDGGILINVLGRLQCDEDPVHQFNQVFVLKPAGNSFYCAHDIFRLGIHNTL